VQVNILSLVMNIRLSRDSEIEREMPCLAVPGFMLMETWHFWCD
jgi:hypothetical protein